MPAKRKSKKRKRKLNLLIILIVIFAFVVFILNKSIRARLMLLFYSPDKNKIELEKTKKDIGKYSVFGIDVSQYQEIIVWKKLKKNEDINFVFVRASAGTDHRDIYFNYNWSESKKNGFKRGAYHYYRPDENSIKQAKNFIRIVDLEKGDLPPVLDIEDYSDIQSLSRLKTGLLRWLNYVEKHYGVTPLIYTYHKFYSNHLADDKRFDNYDLWIARYGNHKKYIEPENEWIFWQYSKRGQAEGIRGDVDFNVYKADTNSLNKILIKN